MHAAQWTGLPAERGGGTDEPIRRYGIAAGIVIPMRPRIHFRWHRLDELGPLATAPHDEPPGRRQDTFHFRVARRLPAKPIEIGDQHVDNAVGIRQANQVGDGFHRRQSAKPLRRQQASCSVAAVGVERQAMHEPPSIFCQRCLDCSIGRSQTNKQTVLRTRERNDFVSLNMSRRRCRTNHQRETTNQCSWNPGHPVFLSLRSRRFAQLRVHAVDCTSCISFKPPVMTTK